MSCSCESANWLITNRSGMAQVVGSLLVPSQFSKPREEVLQKVPGTQISRVRFQGLEIVVFYPEGWRHRMEKERKGVLFHNPNGATVCDFVDSKRGVIQGVPGDILRLRGCPVVMYDYRGTGLNKMVESESSSSKTFNPTYASIVEDGRTMLTYVLDRFSRVEIWGTSLGGGVASISLMEHLKKDSKDSSRVSLVNHDSFSTTGRVVLPGWPRLADNLGWALGGHLDSLGAVQHLIKEGIPMIILAHLGDPVIPIGARLCESVKGGDKVKVILSPQVCHAILTTDMMGSLREALAGWK